MRSVDLLRRQHREVSELLSRARGTAQGGERIRLLGEIAEALTIHAALEEEHLYPLVRDSGLEELARRSERDHTEVRRLVARMLGMKRRDPALDQVLALLDDAVRAHVALEEEELFPRIEERLDGRILESAGERMEQQEGDLRQKELLDLADEPAAAP